MVWHLRRKAPKANCGLTDRARGFLRRLLVGPTGTLIRIRSRLHGAILHRLASWLGALILVNGNVRARLIDPGTGLVSHEIVAHNQFVDVGLVWLGDKVGNQDTRFIKVLKAGTGVTAPTPTDSDIETLLDEGDIDSWSDGVSPAKIAKKRFEPGQAQGVISEVSLHLSDDGVNPNKQMVARALFDQGDITGITNANPGVVSTPDTKDLADGDKVKITGVTGMTEVNGNVYTVAGLIADTSFQLQGTNTTGFGTYTGPSGKWTKVLDNSGGGDIADIEWEFTASRA